LVVINALVARVESPVLKGHDFSRAASGSEWTWALAPEGRFFAILNFRHGLLEEEESRGVGGNNDRTRRAILIKRLEDKRAKKAGMC